MADVRKLIVEVVEARNLVPKDGHGTSSPYVVIDYYGQRRKTRVVARDLNPVWNEVLEFNVGKPSDVFGDMLEVDVNHDRNLGPTTRTNFLGRVRLNSQQFVKKGEEALIYYPLEKRHLFSWVRGEIGLKIYFVDEVASVVASSQPSSEVAKTEPKPSKEAAEEKPNDEPPAKPEEKPNDEPPAKPEEKPNDEPPPATEEALEDLDHNTEEATSMKEEQFDRDKLRTSRSMPEIKIGGEIPMGPQPIPRVSSISSFTTDVSDRFPIEGSSFDLVEKMHYLFVRVVKARSLPTPGNPVAKIVVSGCQVISKPARKTMYSEWDQTFAFRRNAHDASSILEVSVWDPLISSSMSDVAGTGHNFLGGICFDASEIPLRDPPDSPLAPQWYRLEGGGAHKGDLMLATWVGTQADESFPEAWKTDTAGNPSSQSKIYQSPKLWYLRATIIEAQDVSPSSSSQIKAQLGFQVQKTKSIITRNGSSSWNEDLMFVAAEPFTDQPLLLFLVEQRGPKETTVKGVASVPLATIERRVDDRTVVSKWLTFEDPNEEKRVYRGRVQLKVFFDGGYHVMDESAHVCSDYRPTAKQLWKPPIGIIELGLLGCKNLLPMKSIDGKGSTDAYSVAKYGNKWVRTRAISDNLDPKWNEQYTWRVYDPSTVLTIGVFDSWEGFGSDGQKESTRPDFRMGKVRIRISNLETGKVYKNSYPLMLLNPTGVKKMGEVELAVRFVRMSPAIDLLSVYSQPLLPIMHHIKPIGMVQQEVLRTIAVKITAAHLARSEPPLNREVVTYMLDADSHAFSMRKVRANWLRIVNVLSGVIEMAKWFDDTRSWKNPTATVLVHVLLMMLVWFPDLIIPTLAFYMFAIGVWNYRFLRPRAPLPHYDPKLSLAETIDENELDEEFDALPCTRPNEMVRARYDKLRLVGVRVQNMLGDIATQGERVQALVTWRDPRATGIFIGLCLVVAIILYLVPSKMVAMTFGFYYMRHPIFRDRMPSPALNFFRRLPSLSDRVL